MTDALSKAKLIVRNAALDDLPAIVELSRAVYGEGNAYNEAMLRG